ncbi:MAG TPA: tetratricopeptide repeat protein [Planctomycetaceae bacterium]|nr:tetratricopeptide repeat protein [Planctomycetaceae bacterium]
MFRQFAQWAAFALVAMLVASAQGADTSKDLLAKAQAHLSKGRYEEAEEVFRKAADAKADPVAVALGISRAKEAVGAWEEAEHVVADALTHQSGQPQLSARLAELQLARGRLVDAEKTANSVVATSPDDPVARLVLADVYAQTGRFQEANAAYRWFIRFYNARQPESAATLLLVARGSVQYARWNHNTQIFHFVVNTLCPDALKNDPNAWEAHLISGSLLLEKYNREQAVPELEQALLTNPRAAEAIALLGQDALDNNDFEKAEGKSAEALRINPRCLSALQLKADACFLSGRIDASLAAAKAALAVNPHDEAALARAAACALVTDGVPSRSDLEAWLAKPPASGEPKSSRVSAGFWKIWADVNHSDPKPGVFLANLGQLLEARRRFDAAEVCYRRAMSLAPQLPEAKTSLGMLLMRVGRTDQARKILDEAFQADPYHTRVSNFRKVLKLLDGYQAISTEHFVVRVDSKLDKLLGGYIAEYLEEIYPQLVERFGFTPPQRTQIEIFNKSEGISGHEWFSARMVGLPWIQTIGASTGVMVALASPTSAPVPFNWARVLRHEFVHVITVQQSGFNIPHWFTEALAVLNEGYPAPSEWMELLARRFPGQLRTLATLDRGFERPSNSDDWQFAYCQSRLYAEYMIERAGSESLRKMLAAYRENPSTAAAIKKVFGVDHSEFERGYLDFLRSKVAGFHAAERPPTQSVQDLEKQLEAHPKDAPLVAAYSWALLEKGNTGLAKKIAKDALAIDPKQRWAALVLSRLDAEDQKYSAGIARLEPLLDRAAPHAEILKTLAKLNLLDDKPKQAAELCELGVKYYPWQPDFVRGLAAAFGQLGDEKRVAEALTHLCELAPDDAAPRKRLAELALKQQRFADAIRLAKSALYVDVLDAEIHRDLGEAYLGTKEVKQALSEFEAAVELKPQDADIELALARALSAAGRAPEARKRLQSILDRDGKNTAARAALDEMK